MGIENIDDLVQRLRALGAKPCHEQALLRAWSAGLGPQGGAGRGEDFFPSALRRALPALWDELQALARVRAEYADADGCARLLLQLGDGQTVESVLLPRAAVCVSTQVGCAVGCVFCMTGKGGLQRQLGSAEILAQVVLARTRRNVRKVQFMGMGEPSHNMDNVLAAIDLLGTAGGMGHKNLVFSSVGDRRLFERLPRQRVKPALALSLHSTRAELRARLLPHAAAMEPEELVRLGEAYARASGYPIQYQWTLLAGVNDSAAEVEGIARLLAGKYAVMNLIPYNAVAGLDFQRPAQRDAEAMAYALYRRGILTKLRQSAGQDIDGGCGQLRARAHTSPSPLPE